jgi:hypothetical protein
MNSHHQLNDIEFESKFGDCAFDPSLFSHEAHLRLAWIHVRKYGLEKAEENLSTQILRFAKTNGDEIKFHKTLTIASSKAVHHFIQKSSSSNFNDFIKEFPRLSNNFKEIITTHYTKALLEKKEAKSNYIEPDLLPFE